MQPTPDLTKTQTIALGTAIAICLLIFVFTSLIFLTWGHQIWRFLWGQRIPASIQTDFRNAPSSYTMSYPTEEQEWTGQVWVPCRQKRRNPAPSKGGRCLPPPHPQTRNSPCVGRNVQFTMPSLGPAMFREPPVQMPQRQTTGRYGLITNEPMNNPQPIPNPDHQQGQ